MKTIAVIFGGKSAEHDVSIITALSSVIKPLELTKAYSVIPIYITKLGEWYSDPKLADISLYTTGKIKYYLEKLQPVAVKFDGGMSLASAGALGRTKTTKIDVVFPAMHGTYGEDGDLMGLLEMAGVPYVGCGVAAAALAMDKVLAKQVVSANAIPVSKFKAFTKSEFVASPQNVTAAITTTLKMPLFVKPAHLGSSIGITKVKTIDELQNAIEVACHYDDKVIVEEAVGNLIEVTLPIMGNDSPQPALLEQPLTQPEDFFDFETKYMQGGKKGKAGGESGSGKGGGGAQGYSQIPADLPKALYAQAEKVGINVYRALGCSGTARVDMLINSKTQQVYFNEVNPLPGGLYSHNWNKAGVSNIQLVQTLVDLAYERHAQKQSLATSFTTNYLKQF